MTYNVDQIRSLEYPALNGVTYLDFAGGGVGAKSVVEKHSALLQSTILINPHTTSKTQSQVDRVRQRILHLFNADTAEYDLVFVSNTTAGAKLVGECITPEDHYLYLQDSHTSLVGLRALSGKYTALLSSSFNSHNSSALPERGYKILSWPAQSNFNGRRYPTAKWLESSADQDCTISIVDAASYCITDLPDLAKWHPDFMLVSFYKMFGHPDLAGLIVRKTAKVQAFLARRRYFGGGTIEALVSSGEHAYNPRKMMVHAALEDGTLPVSSIMCVDIAISEHKRLYASYAEISKHSSSLAHELRQRLGRLSHESNGRPLCEFYSYNSAYTCEEQGPIVTFNLVGASGEYIGYSDVVSILAEEGVVVRGGTMCNSGAASAEMNISGEQIISNHRRGHVCGDAMDIIDGRLTGAVRVSLGPCSTLQDIDTLVRLLSVYYLESGTSSQLCHPVARKPHIYSLTIFPIKSCGGYTVKEPWTVFPHGLEFDRQFGLVEKASGKIMPLKKFPKMIYIRPHIDKEARLLYIEAFGQTISLSLDTCLPSPTMENVPKPIFGCSDRPLHNCIQYDSDEASRFFSRALGIDCYLVQSDVDTAMVNSSPLLVVSKPSARQLGINAGCDIDYRVFRANIVVEGLEPFVEDQAYSMEISGSRCGTSTLELLEQCRRCNMVSIDPDTGAHNSAPYLALHKTRKWGGRIYFGRYARVLHTTILVPNQVVTFPR